MTTCCNCDKDTSNLYFMCDMLDGEWCPECWEKTACSQGVHGEGCPTKVFVGGRNFASPPVRA